MTITPLDIHQQTFRSSWRGLEKTAVKSYLAELAAELETRNRELAETQDECSRQRKTVSDLQAREQSIKVTMITAQKITDQITENARDEATVIIQRAELQAEKIVERAQDRLTDILTEISEAKRQRAQFLSGLEGLLRTHERLLSVTQESEESFESNLAVLPRRKSAAEAQPSSPPSLRQVATDKTRRAK